MKTDTQTQHTHKPTTSAIIGCPVCFPEKHTPTPWKLITRTHQKPDVRGAGNEPVIEDGYQPRETDAEFIVRAVNAHDELVAAARSVVDDVKKHGEVMADHLEALNTALAKAEGK